MRVCHAAVAALLVSAVAAPAVAQGVAMDADTREVLAYRLTLPKLKQLNEFYADLARQQEADPAYRKLRDLKRELAALEQKEELTAAEEARMAKLEEQIEALEEAQEDEDFGDPEQSLSELAQRMTADPRVAAALKRAGLPAREAATMMLALFQAGFAASMLESGMIKEIPKEVNAENVRFLQTHKAEIAALTALEFRDK